MRRFFFILIVQASLGAARLSAIDFDGDGMSDVWEQKYSVPSADAAKDYDGTGLTNMQKSQLGLDPRNPTSRFHLEIIRDTVNNELRLRIDTAYGKLYQVESSTDRYTWSAVGPEITGTGSQIDVITTMPDPSVILFFRHRYVGDIDADGDGLTAWEERELGTSDNNVDSDGDGMPDAWEFQYGLNPLVNDAGQDPDGDGFTNLQEYQNGTDPMKVVTSTFSPEGGFYLQSQSVTVSCATSGAVIHYTSNGSDPTLADPIVASGSTLSVANTTFVRARAFRTGYRPSDTKSALYQIGGYVLAAGQNHSLALKEDGTLWSWGSNTYGRLGIGSNVDPWLFPRQVNGLTNVVAAAGGRFHSVAAKANGSVWAWGHNDNGQVGDGTQNNDRYVPVAVSSASGLTGGVVAVAAGRDHSVALTSDGTVWTWGDNTYGQLGDGTTGGVQITPVQVSKLSGVIAIAAGRDFTLGLKADGTVCGWGDNSRGQLGDGTSTNSSVPVKSGTIYDVVTISAGEYHAVALKGDGTVWDWGDNTYGQLGPDPTNPSYGPVSAGVANAIAVAAGRAHTLALKSDGTVMAWGYNNYGQLGDGSTNTQSPTPVQIGLTGVTSIAAGDHSLAITRYKGVDLIWAWGYNYWGQLGDETRDDRHVPVLTHTPFDADQDGLLDWQEYLANTDPLNPDTNGDGIRDGDAIRAGISATNMDINGDGYTNAQDIAMGINPFLPYTPPPPPTLDPNDHTPPAITITKPAGAVLVP